VDDLDVAFNGDDHEAANRGVASSDGYGVSAEEPAYEQRQGRVQLRVVYTFQYETEKEKSTGGKIEDGLVGDENVDVARARFLLSSSASRTYKLARQPTTAIIMVAILSTRLTVGET